MNPNSKYDSDFIPASIIYILYALNDDVNVLFLFFNQFYNKIS